MKLEKYMKGVRTCPEAQLDEEFRICDNYPILCSSAFDELNELIGRSRRFKFHQAVPGENWWLYRHVPGKVVVQLGVADEGFISFYGAGDESRKSNGPEVIKHVRFQKTNYHSFVMIHTMFASRGGKNPDVPNLGGAVLCIEDLVKIFQAEDINFCFSRTGYGPNSVKDYSRIVYWPDSDERRVNRKTKR